MFMGSSSLYSQLQQLIYESCYFSSKMLSKCSNPLSHVNEVALEKVKEIEPDDHQIVGNYRVDKLIQSGSYGTVFLGTPILENNNACGIVALKFAKMQWISFELIRNEIEVLKKIGANQSVQANLLVMLDHFENDESLVFVMERLDMDLWNYMEIHKWKPLETRTVASIAKQIFQANVALLDLDVIHSDIKLENIMVVDRKATNLQIKLIDYGCSVPRSEPEQLEYCTPAYSAPEHGLGLPLCEKSDSWSLGVVLFELYTGLQLFPGTQFDQIIRQVHEITGLPDNYLFGRNFLEFYGKKKQNKRKSSKAAHPKKDPKSVWKHRGFRKLFKMLMEFDLYGSVLQQAVFGMCILLLLYFSKKSKEGNLSIPERTVELTDLNNKIMDPEELITDAPAKKLTELIEGDQIGNYHLQKLLCLGAYGKVFSATSVRGKKKDTYALKFAISEKANCTGSIYIEIDVLNKILSNPASHAHLLIMREHFLYEMNSIIVMEKLDCDLFEYLREIQSHKPLDAKVVVDLTKQILKGHTALLDMGIIHADIKLENIMLVDRNAQQLHIKLIDYGCSVSKDETTYLKSNTLYYFAPESLLGLPVSEKIDSWSLGIVIFELYTGLSVFDAITFNQLIRKIYYITGLPDNYMKGKNAGKFFKRNHNPGSYPFATKRKHRNEKKDFWNHQGFSKLFKYGQNGLANRNATVEDNLVCKLVKLMIHRNASS